MLEKKFCEFLREHAMKMINLKKKKKEFTKKSSKNCMKMQKFVIFANENLTINIERKICRTV